MPAHFSAALFTFLRQLKRNNDWEWFEANRARYIADVEQPMLQFIGDMAPHLRAISRAIAVDRRRFGGSMYRIYRDTRFSSDKSPYKTHVAAHFAHDARRKVPAVPGFYLHLEPGDCLGGGGIYHPDTPSLTRIRTAIVEDEKAWAAIKALGVHIEGESLTRAPAGFDPAHRFIEDLRRKDHFSVLAFSEADVCAPDFLDRYAECCERVSPLVAFVAKALGLKW